MTPILILLFGVSPATAVGTDLLFAAVTKTVGSIVHGYNETIDWRVVRRLAIGSIPATALALIVLASLNAKGGGAHGLITGVLSIALLLTAGVLIARNRLYSRYAQRLAALDDRTIGRLTIAMGAALGLMVTSPLWAPERLASPRWCCSIRACPRRASSAPTLHMRCR